MCPGWPITPVQKRSVATPYFCGLPSRAGKPLWHILPLTLCEYLDDCTLLEKINHIPSIMCLYFIHHMIIISTICALCCIHASVDNLLLFFPFYCYSWNLSWIMIKVILIASFKNVGKLANSWKSIDHMHKNSKI